MNVILFSGVLGSGKTTLLLEVARRLAETGQRLCVIQNEIGEIGIDQHVLQDRGLRVWELTAGCICCQIAGDLVTTLQEISECYQPETVLVEGSGVARPAGVLSGLSYYKGDLGATRVATLIDPTRIEAFREVMGPFVEAQAQEADVLVITKTDEADGDQVLAARRFAGESRPGAPLCLVPGPGRSGLEAFVVVLFELMETRS